MTTQTVEIRDRTSKVEYATDALYQMALRLGPGGKLPTVRELRRSLGVAHTTLSEALRDLQSRGFLDCKHGSGLYVLPRIGQKNVGLVFGFNIFACGYSPFYSMLVTRCQQRAQSQREQFSFYLDVPSAPAAQQVVPAHRDLAEALEQKKLHGILLPNRRSHEQVQWFEAQGVPVVSMSADPTEPNCVGLDYAEMVRQGVKLLANQGCRRIGLISAHPLHRPEGESANVRAYRAMLAKLGLSQPALAMRSLDDASPSDSAADLRSTEELGYWTLMKLLADDPHALDGLVVEDDMATRGVIAAARKLRLKVGGDLKIATHANKGSPALREYETLLTLLEVDPEEIVEAMFGMLERRMAGEVGEQKSIRIKPRKQGTFIDISHKPAGSAR